MICLLLPLVGPMQSWGTRSRFQERDTEGEPTKSGVVGILCAAIGRDRDASLQDFSQVDLGVRVDREGILRREFQTAEGVALAKGGISPDAQISNRAWLADAAFLAALSGPESLLRQAHSALANPKWALFLGRKSYTPSQPIYLPDGLVEAEDLRGALLNKPLLAPTRGGTDRIRLVLPADQTSGETRMDDPLSFAYGRRSYALRNVRTEFVPLGEVPQEVRHGA